MTIKDILVLAALFLWVCVAILHMRKCRKNGKCIGCGGDCANCGKSHSIDERRK